MSYSAVEKFGIVRAGQAGVGEAGMELLHGARPRPGRALGDVPQVLLAHSCHGDNCAMALGRVAGSAVRTLRACTRPYVSKPAHDKQQHQQCQRAVTAIRAHGGPASSSSAAARSSSCGLVSARMLTYSTERGQLLVLGLGVPQRRSLGQSQLRPARRVSFCLRVSQSRRDGTR